MSYDISFRVKVEGVDSYIPVGECDANITSNLKEMIKKTTGLPWINEANNGLVRDIIPSIATGLQKLMSNPSEYKQYESPNGWGTIEGCRRFFLTILEDWDCFQSNHEDLVDVACFWID